MKMWKKLAAALLVAVLTMVMLTACGGDAPIAREKETEEKAIGWIQEYMSGKGYTVTKDAKLDPLVDAALPQVVKQVDAALKNDTAEANKQAAQTKAVVQQKFNETHKKAYYYLVRSGKGTLSQRNINSFMDDVISRGMLESLKSNGVDAPKSVGVGITTQGERVYIFIIITD